MKTIKENWKLVLIVAAGIVAVIFMCIFGIQGAQNKAFALEEQVNTADSDIKVQSRKDHKLDEWRSFCKWVEELPYSELIIETAVSLEVGRMFGEPFPWTKEAGKRMGANSCSMKDVEEAIKRFDPNDGVKSHMTMIKED